MSSKFSKILSIVAGLIGLIGFYFFVRVMQAGDEAIETDAAVQSAIVSPFISFAVFVMIATAIIAVLFSLGNLFKHPDVLKRSLISVALMGVVLAISYSFADGGEVYDSVGKVLEDGEAGAVSRWVSTGINFSAILLGIGLLFFVVDFVRSLLSK